MLNENYGVEAFEKLNQSYFVFIISDWDMQPMTGIAQSQ